MDALITEIQQAPAREVVRDRRGVIIGVIERQGRMLMARDARGTLLGSFDGQITRRARGGQIVGRTNLLAALLLWGR